MLPPFSQFAAGVEPENAFTVLAAAKALKAGGKDVVELEIGDSPFPSSPSAVEAGIAAIRAGQCHYGPSIGLPEYRAAAAEYVHREHGLDVSAENIVAGPGAKNFEQLFCEVFLDPGDAVLVFSPHFPTYPPNIARRGARVVYSQLEQEHEFRPNLADVERFLNEEPQAKAIFLNSPHNPTGGVATEEDILRLCELVRSSDAALFSDEPYDQMVWRGRHVSPLSQPGMLERCVAAYTFSKSFSMSGWRLGFAVSAARIVERLGVLTNTALSCVPPFTQLAGIAAMQQDGEERDRRMATFRRKVDLLVERLNQIAGITCLMPGGTFYVFPNVRAICNRLQITSHGLAMYLLEGADDRQGVACLGGECFGPAGTGFLRLSCAEPDERLEQAVTFIAEAVHRDDRAAAFLQTRPHFRSLSGKP